jgi:hypothetical protein
MLPLPQLEKRSEQFQWVFNCANFSWVSGGAERRGNHFDHSPFAQGAAALLAASFEKRSRVAAPGQGWVHHQVRHVWHAEGSLQVRLGHWYLCRWDVTEFFIQAHAEQGCHVDWRLRKGQNGQGRRQDPDEHYNAAEKTLQSPLHVPTHWECLLSALGALIKCCPRVSIAIVYFAFFYKRFHSITHITFFVLIKIISTIRSYNEVCHIFYKIFTYLH